VPNLVSHMAITVNYMDKLHGSPLKPDQCKRESETEQISISRYHGHESTDCLTRTQSDQVFVIINQRSSGTRNQHMCGRERKHGRAPRVGILERAVSSQDKFGGPDERLFSGPRSNGSMVLCDAKQSE